MGVSCASWGGSTFKCFKAVDCRVADDVPELAGEHQRKHEGNAQAVQGLDNAVAQFLQVIHEGHAQHALFFFLFGIRGGAGGGGGGGGGALITAVVSTGGAGSKLRLDHRRLHLGRTLHAREGELPACRLPCCATFLLRCLSGVDGFRRRRRVRRLRGARLQSRAGTPRHGSIRRRLGRHAGFGALRCGCAYCGWICFSGWVRIGAKGAGIVVRGVVVRCSGCKSRWCSYA